MIRGSRHTAGRPHAGWLKWVRAAGQGGRRTRPRRRRPSAVGGRGQGASARRKSSGRRKQEAIAARREASVPLLAFWVAGPVQSTPRRLGWALTSWALGRRTRRPGSEPGLFLAPPPPKRCRACHAAGEHPSRATPAQTSAMPPRAPALPGCPGHEQGLSRRRLAARRWGTPRRHRAVHGCGGRGRTEVEMTCGSHMSVYDNVQSA